MKGKLEQPDLGISNKEYLELVLNNKRVTRGSVTSFTSPHFLPQNGNSLERGYSNSSNKSKGKSSKDNNHSNHKEKHQRALFDDQDPPVLGTRRKSSQMSEITLNNSNNGHKQTKHYQQVKPIKPFKYQEVNLEIVKPIKLFQFEQASPQVRNEYPLGLNLLKHRHVKFMQKEVNENKERIKCYNAFISKRNKNDYTQISLEYFDEKLNQSHDLSTTLNLVNPKDRSFMLTQEIGVIELDHNQFEHLFHRFAPIEVNFETMKTKNNLVNWPVVVLNNCAVDLKIKEFLTYEIEDDCDFLKDYLKESTIYEHLLKSEETHDRLVVKKEPSSFFEEEHEGQEAENLRKIQEEMKEIFGGDDDNDGSDFNNLMEEEKLAENDHNEKKNPILTSIAQQRLKGNRTSDDTDNIFGSDDKEEENESLRSLEEQFQKENAQEKRLYEKAIEEDSRGIHRANIIKKEEDLNFEEHEDYETSMHFSDLPLKKKVKTENEHHIFMKREKLEEEFYHNIQQIVPDKELASEGTVLIWLVGTGYFQVKKIHDIKPLNSEIKTHLSSLAKKSKFLNRMLVHFGKLTKNYNTSTQESDYSLPISNKLMKDNLFKVLYLGNEDRVPSPMVPLTLKEKKNETFTILRVLDDYSLFIVKNTDSKTFVKISSFLPPLEPVLIERLDNVALLQQYNKELFVKKVLFPKIYPSNLIDANFDSFNVPHQRVTITKNFHLMEDPNITSKIRCKQCNYILGDLSYHKCHKCDDYFHDHCITAKKPNSLADPLRPMTKNDKKTSNHWVCNPCKSCSYCTSSTNKEYMVYCTNCEEAYHAFCVQALHPNYRIERANKFICLECALCQMCGCEIPNFSDRNIVDDLTLCSDCIEVRLRKEYCPICNKRWDIVQAHLTKEEIEMIECQCKMWVHKYCDTELSKDVFKEFALTGRAYHCPNCRKNLKNKQLADFITILVDLDEHRYFTAPVDELTAPNYRQVISCPMDFGTMERKALTSQYLENPFDLIKADFDLICNNAFIYNLPKSHVFSVAKKVKKYGDKAFQYFKELIECSDKEFLKYSKKLTPNHYAAQFKKEIDEYYVDILFEEKGMNPLTRIRVIDNSKPNPFVNNNTNSIASSTRKNQNKEVYIEVTGLNYLLTEKANRDERKSTDVKSRIEHSNQKGLRQSFEDSEAMNVEPELKKKDSFALVFNEDESKNQMSNKIVMREGVSLIKDLLGMNSKSKPFFYFYPVVIQFTNPDLIKYDICYLCGSFGENEDFLFCNTCQEGYHYYCISKSYNDLDKIQRLKANADYQCPKCKLCLQCNKKSESHDCLICENCDNLYHLNCIYPQVGVLFTSQWRCEECFKCERCGSNKLFSDNLSIENGNVQPEFCEDFKWCYECGLKMAYFKFCKICKKFCQKSISSSKSDKRSLQYINPVEDSVECKTCRYKYHITCYEEEFFPVTNPENFMCENCKVDDTQLHKTEAELENRAQEIINKRRFIKLLMRICESIYNHYLSMHNPNHNHIKDNLTKHLFDYIIEDYEFLTQEVHTKTMLENYKLLNTATKLMGNKFQTQPAITHTSSTRHDTAAPVAPEVQCEHFNADFLLCYLELFDFEKSFPIRNLEELESFHELACKISMRGKQTEVLSTETSREYYDYKGYMKFRDEQLGFWMLLPEEIIYDENFVLINHSYLTDLALLSSICLKQEVKYSYEEILNKPSTRVNEKLSQLLSFAHLVEIDDPYYFEKTYYDGKEVDEKFANIIDFSSEIIWAPYWKTIENIRFSLFTKSILQKKDKPSVLVPVKEMEHDKFAKLFYRAPPKTPVIMFGETGPSHISPLKATEASSTSSGKRLVNHEERSCYEDLKDLMFIEIIAIEIIKRRLKFWLDHKKETTHHQHHYHHGHGHGHGHVHGHGHTKTKPLSSTRHLAKHSEKGQHHSAMQIEEHASHRRGSIHHEPVNSSRMELEDTEAHKIPQNQNKMLEEFPDVTDQDLLMESPMANIECVCCKVTGDRKLSGRLLFVDCDQWVHTNCALWSYDVFENIEGGLVNFFNSYRLSLTTICAFCQRSGATIACFSKKCQRKYHFKCAMSAKCSFLTSKRFYCKNCSATKSLDNRTNTDFSTHRRLYIVRNQNPFTEYANSSIYFKEKPLDMQSGAFNRIGNLTVISAKKYNSELKFLLQEYAITKILRQEERRKPIFITISLQENKYFYKFNRIDDSVLINKKTLYSQKTAHEGEESWKILETAENFFESLNTFIHHTIAPSHHLSTKEKITKKELLGEFLALTNFDVRKWLKSSVMIDEDDGTEKKEYPSFKEYYYSQNIDNMDPFSRLEKVEEIYGRIVPKIQSVIQNSYYKDQSDRLKNPREKSFNKQKKNIKSNKRKADSLGHFEFGAEDIDNHYSGGLFDTKFTQIQSTELEMKLKGDYAAHKKKPSKILVAPSFIHKYGLFALENFNKNEIVIEYCGEIIRNKIADLRENQYKLEGFGDCFMFRADKDSVIDASFKGNQARYLNHSCNPNCSSIIIEVDHEPKIVMYANRPIYPGEELTYDYQFDIEAEKIECTCGAKNCQGRLN